MIHHFVSVQSISVALCNYREIVNSYKKARAFLPTTNCKKVTTTSKTEHVKKFF